jgi:hypothetical protein
VRSELDLALFGKVFEPMKSEEQQEGKKGGKGDG